jgi:tetratricopeptide (TPR) repeat protein
MGDLWTWDRAEKVRKAIEAFEAALTVYSKDAYPADWASTQTNLGVAWENRPTGKIVENVKKAIAAYEAALTVYTKEAYPRDWARTQMNLGNAWRHLSTGDKVKNVKNAVAAYEAALSGGPTDLPPEVRRSVKTKLSWHQLLIKDFIGALSTCERAPDEDAADLLLQTNHAHAFLFLGRTEEARQLYGKYVGQEIAETGKSWERIILEDLDDLEENGLTSPEFTKIREMLKSKTAEVGSAPAAK